MELRIGMKFHYSDDCLAKNIIDTICGFDQDVVLTKFRNELGNTEICRTSREEILDKIAKYGLLSSWEGRFKYETKSRG